MRTVPESHIFCTFAVEKDFHSLKIIGLATGTALFGPLERAHKPLYMTTRNTAIKTIFFLLLATLSMNLQAAHPTATGDTLEFAANDTMPNPCRKVNLKALVDSMIQNDDLCKYSQVGMMFYDLTNDTVMLDRGGQQLMRPASVMKALTAVTALSELGGSYQFSTRLYCTGTVKDSALTGDIYIKAGFDPRFGSDDMAAFMEALKSKHIYKIQGNIFADISFKDTLTLGHGWLWHWRADEKPLTPLLYNSNDNFMQKFFEYLDNEEISHPNGFSFRTVAKDGAKLLCTRSHTIDQILMRMLKESDNLYAESLFYQLGARDGISYAGDSHSAKFVERFIRNSLHMSTAPYTIADGCGLSVYDCISPELMVHVLRHAYKNNNIFLHFYPALPIAGGDGTLRNRMQSGPARFNVRAKTGSVNRVVTLAGYCKTADGRDVAFAIFHEGVLSGNKTRDWDDRILQKLTE